MGLSTLGRPGILQSLSSGSLRLELSVEPGTASREAEATGRVLEDPPREEPWSQGFSHKVKESQSN